ncbi:MAG: hypothetical protein JWN70_4890, partial [Planctomycetaceae bacterium]|nr:hypothetical protein [Planctomycetaceae bacterium]
AVTGPLYAQDFNKLPSETYPLDQTYEELLQSTPNDIPILVRHLRQDPNALRPSDALQPAAPQSTPGGAVARNLLGVPQRNETLARRGRLRTVAGSQNRATAMIGDLFGGGTTSLTLTPTIANAIPYANFPETGTNYNGFAGLKLPNEVVGPFFGGPVIGTPPPEHLPLLSTFGTDSNHDGVIDTWNGLQQYAFTPANGADINNVQNAGPFSAVVSGQTVVTSGGDTVPLIQIQQPLKIADVPSPAVGGAVGRLKIAENTSPMPRDRVFFNYSSFQNVPLTQGGLSVNRFTPGFEKTFNEGTASIEFRAPFATTLSSNVSATGISDGDKLEFGDISLTYKSLFYRDDDLAFSGGMQVGLPTADPVNINLSDGTTIVRIKNQTVHLMPFVGALYTPDDRLFAQAFLQFDVAANGNDVLANLDLTKLKRVGSVQDTTYTYLDLSVGYWTYLADDQEAYLSGIAPMFELHYNQSLQSGDVIRAGNNFQLGSFGSNFSVVNAVIGTTFQFGPSSALTMGYAVPLGGGNDQQFDGEFRVFFNKRFGPQTRQIRAI